ncbi:hypothetical protein D3C72_1419950 [compost metagenome]
MGAVGQAERPDPAVAPVLLHQPGHGVEAVLGLVGVFGEDALGAVAPPAIDQDIGVAAPRELGGDLGLGARRRIGGGAVGVIRPSPVIGGAFQQGRQTPLRALRQIDIGGQTDAVTHRDHDVAHDADAGQRRQIDHRTAGSVRKGALAAAGGDGR